MQVLVAAASKYGATLEIAQAIGELLDRDGLDVTVTAVEHAAPADEFDAVVLGSAIYMGQWLKPARSYVEDNEAALHERPVWLFSSGPLGDPPAPDPEALDLSAIAETTAPEEQRVFGGKLDKARLKFGDRAIVTALRAPETDDRPWSEIEAWAHEIARALLERAGD